MGLVNNFHILNETPNYEMGDFGLPFPVWIGSDANAPHHNPRIKLRIDNGIPLQLTPDGVEIQINDISILPKNGVDGRVFKELVKWFLAYRDIISSYHYVVCNMGAKDVKKPNNTLKHALNDRYKDILKNGISDYVIPFHVVKPYVAHFDNDIIDTRKYMNYLHDFEKKEQEQQKIEQTIKEYKILSGINDI